MNYICRPRSDHGPVAMPLSAEAPYAYSNKVLQLQKEGFVCNYRITSTNNNESGYTVYYGFELKWCETHQIGL